MLQQKKDSIDSIEDSMALIDNQIDSNFDIMEDLERALDEKTMLIK